MADKLNALIDKFTNDPIWNESYKDGTRRFGQKISWIESMIINYAEFYGMETDDVVDHFEKNRDYSWPNFYQEANFPKLINNDKVLIFNNIEDFKKADLLFECGRCGNISKDPQECEHRNCDWCSYGLIRSMYMIVIKSHSLVPIPVFKPIKKPT